MLGLDGSQRLCKGHVDGFQKQLEDVAACWVLSAFVVSFPLYFLPEPMNQSSVYFELEPKLPQRLMTHAVGPHEQHQVTLT